MGLKRSHLNFIHSVFLLCSNKYVFRYNVKIVIAYTITEQKKKIIKEKRPVSQFTLCQ